MFKISKVLVPVDFSREAKLALQWAAKLLNNKKRGTIVLLHRLAPVPIFPEAGYDAGVVLEAQWKSAKKKLRLWGKKVPAPLKAITLCVEGPLSTSVKEIAEKEKVDLVVMTTHGRHGFSRVVHPNATEAVVRETHCPVLVLHLNSISKKAIKKKKK